MKKYGCMLGMAAVIGATILLMIAALIYSLRDTSVRLTIDGLVLDNPKLELRAAVANGDSTNIRRAFDKAIYCSGQKESEQHEWMTQESIPTLEGYLTNSSPLVRLYAAKGLSMFGASSGFPVLIDFVSAPQPLEESAIAAGLLAQYRRTESVPALTALYGKESDRQLKGQVLEALETLSPKTVTSLLPLDTYYENPLAIRDYALGNYQPFVPQITASFQKSTQPEIKAAAAWGLAMMNNDASAIDYLEKTFREMLRQKQRPFDMRDMVKYVGTIHDPRMKPLLEEALGDEDSNVVSCAVVNLLYNQGGSEKAKSVLAEALHLKRMNLQWDFVLQVAAQFKNDPVIKEAGDRFAANDIMESWQLWTTDRQNWPTYNWIDAYVIELNDKK